jgi:ATP-dependent Clp protease ATP-binding subunit ClpA
LGNATYLRRPAESEKHLSVIGRISEGEWSRVFRVTPASGAKTLPVFSHGEAARRFLRAEEAGQLTESVRRRPYSVLLLDEIEKAHPDVFNILLQILDDGRLTDAQGRTVDFKHTVIIMTSNLGSDRIQAHVRRNESFEELKADMDQILKHSLRPEFINRIDEVIVFRTLDKEQISEIAPLLLE